MLRDSGLCLLLLKLLLLLLLLLHHAQLDCPVGDGKSGESVRVRDREAVCWEGGMDQPKDDVCEAVFWEG
jgi:hypothetical protein